ncbi:MAG TPA: hypothetical protein VGB30_06420 [bacterium]|jgi:hypothetical protein
MAWCLDCSYEYAESMESCPSCGNAVNGRAGKNGLVSIGRKKFHAIRAVSDNNIAKSMKAHLEENGYEVSLKNGESKISTTLGLDPSYENLVILLVPQDQASDAAKMLRTDSVEVSDDLSDIVIGKEDDDFEDDFDYQDDDPLLGNDVFEYFDDFQDNY